MSTFFLCLHSFTKDIQQRRRDVYLKEVGCCFVEGVRGGLCIMLIPIFFLP